MVTPAVPLPPKTDTEDEGVARGSDPETDAIATGARAARVRDRDLDGTDRVRETETKRKRKSPRRTKRGKSAGFRLSKRKT